MKTLNETAKEQGKAGWQEVDSDSSPALVVTGSEVDRLSPSEWFLVCQKPQLVFARTSPEQKLKIVTQFQDRKHVVAVTGDGVNDR